MTSHNSNDGIGNGGVEAAFRLTLGDFTLDAELSLPSTGVSGIFGPSGSGKTTLLRCLAGLEPQAHGRLRVGGQLWQSTGSFVAPERRAVGVVFQDTRVFDHLTVAQNLLYGFRRTAVRRRRIDFDEVVEMLGIGHLLERQTRQLSGGEGQRVAIGRALLASPALLLLDEPMAALDSPRKAEIFRFLDRLHRHLDIPIVYVSHELDEITRLADTLAILRDGRVIDCGPTIDTLMALPAHDHGRALAVMLSARVAGHDPGCRMLDLELPGGVAARVAGAQVPSGQQLSLRVAANQVALHAARPEPDGAVAVVEVRVKTVNDSGAPLLVVRLEAGEMTLLSLVDRARAAALALAPGRSLHAVIHHAEVVGGGVTPADDNG